MLKSPAFDLLEGVQCGSEAGESVFSPVLNDGDSWKCGVVLAIFIIISTLV
jgi:hypothetical protein